MRGETTRGGKGNRKGGRKIGKNKETEKRLERDVGRKEMDK